MSCFMYRILSFRVRPPCYFLPLFLLTGFHPGSPHGVYVGLWCEGAPSWGTPASVHPLGRLVCSPLALSDSATATFMPPVPYRRGAAPLATPPKAAWPSSYQLGCLFKETGLMCLSTVAFLFVFRLTTCTLICVFPASLTEAFLLFPPLLSLPPTWSLGPRPWPGHTGHRLHSPQTQF